MFDQLNQDESGLDENTNALNDQQSVLFSLDNNHWGNQSKRDDATSFYDKSRNETNSAYTVADMKTTAGTNNDNDGKIHLQKGYYQIEKIFGDVLHSSVEPSEWKKEC